MNLRQHVSLLLFAYAFALPALANASDNPPPTAYDLRAVIDPAKGHIALSGTVDAIIAPSSKTLVFSLHETFAISKLLVDGRKMAYSMQPEPHNPLRPASHDIVISLPPDQPSGPVHLDIAYEGKLKDLPEFGASDAPLSMDDQINAHMVELANYSSWYPQIGVYGPPIKVELQVTLPWGWTAICSGRKLSQREERGLSITQWSSPKDTDILITAAPNYKMRSARLPGGNLEIYYTQLPDAFVTAEMDQIEQVMEFYTARFGPTEIPSGTVKQVYSPKRHGQGRAGIARPGMIVTSEGVTLSALANDPHFTLLQDVAHEIGHFWWNFGAGQGDWINEAFAEYSSAMAVEKVVSRDQFQSVLQRYRQQAQSLPANAPSLAIVPFDGSGFVIRYYKGSLMLDDLRRILGDEQFFAAAQAFFERYRGTPASTADFRAFWREHLGDHSAVVDSWLDSSGGLPSVAEITAASSR